MMQSTLDFSGKLPPAVQEKIANGMHRADEHADPQWRHIIDACIVAAARRLPTFTVDDVFTEISVINEIRKAQGKELVDTHRLCAIGPAMIRARKLGVITPTNQVQRSKIQGKNGNLQRIWTSNFHGGAR